MANEAEHIKHPDLVAAHLWRLQKERLLVSITITGTSQVYNSMVVSVSADQRTLLVDMLHPQSAHDLLMQRGDFVLSAQHDGVELGFKGRVSKVVDDDGKPAYLVDFPDTLIYKQRRQWFRAPIGMDMEIIAHVSNDEQQSSQASIHNVSRGGLCLQFDHNQPLFFKKLSRLHCQFRTSEGVDMDCEVEVRNMHKDDVHRHARVGVEFKDLDNPQQRHIQRFVAQMERRMLRRKQQAS